MDKHIIFSDVDGTVYAKDHIIHPQTIKDIKMAQDLGVEIAICTGNASLAGQNMMRLADKLGVRYIVGSNGASLYDMKEKKFLYTSVIPQDEAQRMLDLAVELEASVNWWDTDNIWSTPYADIEKRDAIAHAILNKGDQVKVSTKAIGDILKIEFYGDVDHVEKAQALAEKLGYQAARMKVDHVEITHIGVSKGHGVKELCKLLGVDIANTMGVGDSPNDIGMFEVVGHSYAMDNAHPKAKEIAMHYTSDVKQNGLGEAIVDYLHRTKLDRNNK